MPSRKDGPPSIWNTHGFLETFLRIQLRSLFSYPQELHVRNRAPQFL